MKLDLLAQHPAMAGELDRDGCLELIAQAAAVHAVLVARYAETAPISDDATTIGTEEAARLLGVAPKTLANQANGRYKDLRVRNLSRRLAWSRRAIAALQSERGLTLGSSRPTLLRAQGGNRRRRGPAPFLRRQGEGGAV